nr:hypothetical protein [Xanthomonas translucens]
MRPAERRAPVFAQLARRVQFDAARTRAVHRHVRLGQAVGQGLADIGLGHVVLTGVEQHQRGVEATIEMAALEADLAAAAEHRIEEAAIAAAVVLRVEDLGIADERRIHRGDRVDQPGTGHGLATDVGDLVGVGRELRRRIVAIPLQDIADRRQRLGGVHP